MKFDEIKTKTKKELMDLLCEVREEMRELRFKVGEKQAKNVRTLREQKKTIARVMTLLNIKE